MPDIDTFAVLSEFYNVLINELISGERLEGQAVVQRSEENVRDIAKGFKRKLKTVYTISVTAFICLALVFLCVAMFLNARENMLYPIDVSDGQSNKVYKGALETVKNNSSADLFADTVGDTEFAFALPQGYVKINKTDLNRNVYASDKEGILIYSGKEADVALPIDPLSVRCIYQKPWCT